MNAKDAYNRVMRKYPKTQIVSCYEYTTLFVFGTDNDAIDGLVSVNKTTGEVRDFKPFYIPVDEYRAGKKIANFR